MSVTSFVPDSVARYVVGGVMMLALAAWMFWTLVHMCSLDPWCRCEPPPVVLWLGTIALTLYAVEDFINAYRLHRKEIEPHRKETA